MKLFFAPILGIAERNIQASATAVIAAPAAGTGIFPMVISKNMLNKYWNSTTRTPVLQNGVAPTLKIGTIYKINGVDVLSGQWTSFTVQNPSADYTKQLIHNGSTVELSIGMNTFIQPGVEASLYKEVPVGRDVAVFVVDNIMVNSWEPIVAIAGFHISGYSQGQKYVEGHFIDNVSIGTTNPGTGNGVPYGAYTPPILVE